MWSEGNALKNEESTFGFYFATMLQHTSRFWSRISKQRTMWQNWSIPHTLLTWLQLIFTLYFNWNQQWGDRIRLWCWWHHSECNGGAEKSFTKWLPGMLPTTLLQSLAEEYSCTKGLFWRKCSLKHRTFFLCFSETKWFQEHFEATTYKINAQFYNDYNATKNWHCSISLVLEAQNNFGNHN